MEESDKEIKKSTYGYEKRNVCNESEDSQGRAPRLPGRPLITKFLSIL